MSTLRGGSFLVPLLAAALALGACGGDEGGNDGTTTGAGSPEFTTNSGTTTGTTEATTTGTTERERTGTSEDRTTNTKEGGDDRGGSGGSGGGGSGGKDDSGSAAQPAEQPGNVFKVAQTVCNSFLPKPIERSLEEGKREPEEVARDYSRGFSDKQEKRAYEGCLAGLKKR